MSLHEKMTNYESQLRYYGVFKRPAELKLLLEEIPKSRGQHVKITPDELAFIDMRLGKSGANNLKLDGMSFSMIDSANGELYRFYNEEQMALVYKGSKKYILIVIGENGVDVDVCDAAMEQLKSSCRG